MSVCACTIFFIKKKTQSTDNGVYNLLWKVAVIHMYRVPLSAAGRDRPFSGTEKNDTIRQTTRRRMDYACMRCSTGLYPSRSIKFILFLWGEENISARSEPATFLCDLFFINIGMQVGLCGFRLTTWLTYVTNHNKKRHLFLHKPLTT